MIQKHFRLIVALLLALAGVALSLIFWTPTPKEQPISLNQNPTPWESMLWEHLQKSLPSHTTGTWEGTGEAFVLVNFWATWCPPCVMEMPEFERIYKETSRDQLRIIALSDEDNSDIQRFLNSRPLSFPVIQSGVLPLEIYNAVEALPVTLLFNNQGQVVWRMDGSTDYETLKKTLMPFGVQFKDAP
jgi:thiol-disulfide isomerase/thioredoxin